MPIPQPLVDPGQCYTVLEYARLFQISPGAAWRHVLKGVRRGQSCHKLPSLKVGGKRLIRGSDILAFIEDTPVEAPTTTATSDAPQSRTPASHRRAAEAATRQLHRTVYRKREKR